jgi:hypothetical protein
MWCIRCRDGKMMGRGNFHVHKVGILCLLAPALYSFLINPFNVDGGEMHVCYK